VGADTYDTYAHQPLYVLLYSKISCMMKMCNLFGKLQVDNPAAIHPADSIWAYIQWCCISRWSAADNLASSL